MSCWRGSPTMRRACATWSGCGGATGSPVGSAGRSTAAGGRWRDGLRRCAACRSETSVTAGTIFAGTRTPLVSWFAAIWYVVNQKQGVSALGLQRVLGLGSYQTAWAWLHKLRRAMVLPGRELLSGAVEVDESYVGARRASVGGRGAGSKAIVAIAVEGDQAPERVRMRRIPDVTQGHADRLRARPRRPRQRGPHRRLAGLLRRRPLPLQARRHQRVGQRRPRRTSSCRTCTSSPRSSSAGSSAPTRARSATPSSTTTSTSSPSASTAATHATAGCSSTASSRARWQPIHTPTRRSPVNRPPDQSHERNRGSEPDSQRCAESEHAVGRAPFTNREA